MKRVAFGEPSKTKPPPRGAFFLTKPHFIPPSRTTPIPPLFQRAIRACPPHMPTLCFHHVSMANAAKPYVSLRYPSANPLETCHFSLTHRSELTPETFLLLTPANAINSEQSLRSFHFSNRPPEANPSKPEKCNRGDFPKSTASAPYRPVLSDYSLSGESFSTFFRPKMGFRASCHFSPGTRMATICVPSGN